MFRLPSTLSIGLVGTVGLLAILFLAFVALFGPTLTHADPGQISNQALQPPSPDMPFGTDQIGRNVFVEVVFGARVSLLVGVLAAGAAVLIGIVVGASAGFFGDRADIFLMRMSEIFQVIPSLILATLVVAILGASLPKIIAVLALLAWPTPARVMRGEVLRVKQLDFVDACRCLGYGELWILRRQVIPNAIGVLIPLACLEIGGAILREAALSFLGLSDPGVVSWGKLLNLGQDYLFQAWWIAVFPGIAIFATVLSYNLFGDGLGAVLNPRTRT